MNKKIILIAVAALLVLGSIGAGLYYVFGNQEPTKAEETKNKKRVTEPVNVLPVADRPVIYLVPIADGRNIDIIINSVKKAATDAEYTIEYMTGTLVQAQENTIKLATLPVSERVFLGSCSAGGKCTYHEDITGGTLRTRFAGTESYALKSDWRYYENTSKEIAFSSKDAFFQIESPALAAIKYLIIFNNPGYPDGLQGTPVSDPYVLQGGAPLTGKAKLTMRAQQEGNLTIMGWDGTAWKEFTGTSEGKNITAEVELLPLYIVVTK